MRYKFCVFVFVLGFCGVFLEWDKWIEIESVCLVLYLVLFLWNNIRNFIYWKMIIFLKMLNVCFMKKKK